MVLSRVDKALCRVDKQTDHDGRYRHQKRDDQAHRIERARLRITLEQLRLQQVADHRATAKETEHDQRPQETRHRRYTNASLNSLVSATQLGLQFLRRLSCISSWRYGRLFEATLTRFLFMVVGQSQRPVDRGASSTCRQRLHWRR